jgi:cytochrome P450
MRTLASDVFVRLVLRVDDHERATALVLAIRRMLLTPGNPPLTVPGRGDPVLGPALDAAFRRRLAPVAAVLEQEIADHRAGRRSGEGLLGRLAATDMPAPEIVDRLTVVVAAAQEPGSIGMTNVLYEIARRPGLDERFLAADEADREAIVHEALRLRPVAQASLRRLTEPARIDGHDLPADTVLALPSLLLHRDPAAFPEPDAFRPERFAGGAPSGAPFFPFGRGVRSCIGEPVARAELAAAVPAILERLRLTAAWPRPEKMVVRGTVLVPHRSALVRSRRR